MAGIVSQRGGAVATWPDRAYESAARTSAARARKNWPRRREIAARMPARAASSAVAMKDDAVAADQGAGVSSAHGGCPSMSAPCSPKASKAAGLAVEAATTARRRVQAGAPLLRSTVAAKPAPPTPRSSEAQPSELQSLIR